MNMIMNLRESLSSAYSGLGERYWPDYGSDNTGNMIKFKRDAASIW
jgi:hypothetical protein